MSPDGSAEQSLESFRVPLPLHCLRLECLFVHSLRVTTALRCTDSIQLFVSKCVPHVRPMHAADPAHGDVKLPLHVATPALVLPVASLGAPTPGQQGASAHAADDPTWGGAWGGAAAGQRMGADATKSLARADAVVQMIGKAPWAAEKTALSGVFMPGSKGWDSFAPGEWWGLAQGVGNSKVLVTQRCWCI